MKNIILVFTLLLLGFGVVNAEPSHYIVFEFDGSQVKLLSHNLVDIHGLRSRTQQEVSEKVTRYPPDKHSFAVRLVNDLNESVYHDLVEVPMVLRGEFHGKDGIEGVFVELKRQVFVVRVPQIPRTRLHLRTAARLGIGSGATTNAVRSTQEIEQVFDLDESLAAESAATQEQNSEVLPGIINGDSANRLDFLFMGDGYTSEEKDKFRDDVSHIIKEFFLITPWNEYPNFANIHVLFTPSAQSGADHPPYLDGCNVSTCCGDSQMKTDPLAGRFVDSAFDSTFCTANIHRLLTANYQKVYDAAKTVPGWDLIVLIVNDSTYGGSGGGISVISTHPSVVQLAQHETGHTFAILADEYDYGCTSNCFICSEASNNCAYNITNETDRLKIKWNSWILPTTPIPTPGNDPAYEDVIGLFEGASYTQHGMYRPKDSCMMRTLNAGFCSVCVQEQILKLYEGWGGIPKDGIDLIEPGSEVPPAGKVEGSWNMTFKVDLLQPVGLLEIKWFVNGQEVAGEDRNTFTYTPNEPAAVEIRVRDLTQLVKPEMAGTLLQFSRRWEVTSAAQAETVSTPQTPAGTAYGSKGTSYTYTTGGSVSSRGNTVQYRFDWGDGTCSEWSSATSVSKAWSDVGNYVVMAQAMSSAGVVSAWSGGLNVTISLPLNVSVSISGKTIKIVKVTVKDGSTGKPVDGVRVDFSGLLVKAVKTNRQGFVFARIMGAGTLNIKVSMQGYTSWEKSFQIN